MSTFCDRFAKAEVARSIKAEAQESEEPPATATVTKDEIAAARKAWKGAYPPATAVRGKRTAEM